MVTGNQKPKKLTKGVPMDTKELHAYLVKHDLYKNPAARIAVETQLLALEKLPTLEEVNKKQRNGK